MDAWTPYAVREHCRDAVRAWAELEGKSPEMAEDLVRQYSPAQTSLDRQLVIGFALRLAAWACESWWYLTRR